MDGQSGAAKLGFYLFRLIPLVSVFCELCLGRRRGQDGSPNFLVLFADDMGYGDVSMNGHPTIQTPNIDQLAREGIRFTQWYSAFHVCSPSRASMLTGRLPVRSGTAGKHWTGGVFGASAVGGLPNNETTFAEALKTAGYATGMVGKWHLGQKSEFLPTNNGFDEYFGLPYSDDMGSSAWEKYLRRFEPPLPLLHNTTIIEQPTNLGTLTQRYTEYATDYINRKKDEKFVLYMAFSHVHTPNFVSKEFCNTSSRGKFGDAAAEMDNAVGVIMKALDDAGIRNNTLTFFTSDNGPWLIQDLQGGSAGPFYEGKTTTWEGGVREPGIVSWPGTIAPGRVARQVVTTYDIFPTMMKLAGVPAPTDRVIDGRDMSPLWMDPKVPSQHDCIFLYKGTPEGASKPGLWAIRCGPYKAHFVTNNHVNTTPEIHDPALLYHVERDAAEVYALKSSSDEYKNAMTTIMAAKLKHEASLTPVPNQNLMAMGENVLAKLCCDWNSKVKHPLYEQCTCDVDNWLAWTCGRPTVPKHTKRMSRMKAAAYAHFSDSPGKTGFYTRQAYTRLLSSSLEFRAEFPVSLRHVHCDYVPAGMVVAWRKRNCLNWLCFSHASNADVRTLLVSFTYRSIHTGADRTEMSRVLAAATIRGRLMCTRAAPKVGFYSRAASNQVRLLYKTSW